jgi:hypothetical protein
MMMSILALVISVFGLSIAYAAMSETLTVTGTAKYEAASWNVKFSNLVSEATGTATFTEPALSDTSLSNYYIILRKQGDSVTFTFDVVNDGSSDAILGTISKSTPICSGTGNNAVEDANLICQNLTYTLTYENGDIVSNNDYLESNSSKTMKLTLAFNSNASVLPTNEVTINGLDFNIIYNQD